MNSGTNGSPIKTTNQFMVPSHVSTDVLPSLATSQPSIHPPL
jgi:hypothetical protein